MNYVCNSCKSVTCAEDWHENTCPVCGIGGMGNHEVHEEVKTDVLWVNK